jgi:hypothetical protein
MTTIRLVILGALLSIAGPAILAADTPPVLTNFSWVNKGNCIGAQNPSGTMTMFHPGAAGLGFNWCSLLEPLPPAPYRVIAKLRGHILGKAASLALTLQDSISGKQIVYSIGASDTGVASLAGWKMLSPTVYQTPNSPYFTFSNGQVIGGLLANYIMVRDDLTYRKVYISDDKEVWFLISQVYNTDFTTPTHVGLALRGTGDGLASLMTVHHWEVLPY